MRDLERVPPAIVISVKAQPINGPVCRRKALKVVIERDEGWLGDLLGRSRILGVVKLKARKALEQEVRLRHLLLERRDRRV